MSDDITGKSKFPLVNLSNKDYMEWESRQEARAREHVMCERIRIREAEKKKKSELEARHKENKDSPLSDTTEPPNEEFDSDWEYEWAYQDECAYQEYDRKQEKKEG